MYCVLFNFIQYFIFPCHCVKTLVYYSCYMIFSICIHSCFISFPTSAGSVVFFVSFFFQGFESSIPCFQSIQVKGSRTEVKRGMMACCLDSDLDSTFCKLSYFNKLLKTSVLQFVPHKLNWDNSTCLSFIGLL